MNKKGYSIFNVFITVLVVGALIGVAASQIQDSRTVDSNEVSVDLPFGVFHNLSLEHNRNIVTVNVSNGTGDIIHASNYTLITSVTPPVVEIKDNVSYTGSFVFEYTYSDNTLMGASAILMSLVILFVVIGLIYIIFNVKKTR